MLQKVKAQVLMCAIQLILALSTITDKSSWEGCAT